MKKIVKVALSAAFLAAVSCTTQNSEGYVNFTLGEVNDFVEVVTKGQVSSYTSLPSTSQFELVLKDSYSSTLWSGKIADWDQTTPLSAGNYTVSASYGSEGEEGFDKPVFSGSKNFSITTSGTQTVGIDVSLANCIVKVSTSAAFENYFQDWTFTLNTGAGNAIAFAKGESRGAFLDAYKFTVSGTLTNQAGAVQNFSKEYANLEPATCYNLHFDVSSVGGISITITFDNSTETVNLGTIDLNK